MKLLRVLAVTSALTFAFASLALADAHTKKAPKAPPLVKQGPKAPKLPNTKNPTSQATKQGSSQGKSGGSNYGQKVESKSTPPKK